MTTTPTRNRFDLATPRHSAAPAIPSAGLIVDAHTTFTSLPAAVVLRRLSDSHAEWAADMLDATAAERHRLLSADYARLADVAEAYELARTTAHARGMRRG